MPVLPRELASVVIRKEPDPYTLITGWWVVGTAIFTILPWAVVPVFDAIDSSYRRLSTVCLRLLLSSACNAVAYVFSIIFVVLLIEDSGKKTHDPYDRFDEVATFFVLLLFNVWFVMRNLRGWIQVFSLRRLRPQFKSLQENFSKALYKSPHESTRKLPACIEGTANILISSRLIDNDLQTRTAFLNPFAPKGTSWDLAMWRAFWTQNTRRAVNLTVNGDYNVNPDRSLAQDLPEKGPQWPKEIESENGNAHVRTCTPEVYNSTTRLLIPRNDRDAWATALKTYGDRGRETPQGQQDTRGRVVYTILRPHDGSGLATIVLEKTRCTPHRMTALWYATARFEDMYESLVREIKATDTKLLLPDVFPLWREIAQDIASNLPEKLFLSDDALTCYAGELASSSILLQYYPDRFSELVRLIYEDGRCARWTFGWSGLLSCFSNLWTYDRVFMALLSGLSLLALRSAPRVKKIEPCVRAMLVGYASFAVSERAVGKQIAKLRKAELLHRYKEVRGVTCRGSGVSVTRLACQELNLPAEASCMDGLPAFSTGWAFEYMECKPGNQTPEHGGTHDEIEAKEGSTTACRYPNTHF